MGLLQNERYQITSILVVFNEKISPFTQGHKASNPELTSLSGTIPQVKVETRHRMSFVRGLLPTIGGRSLLLSRDFIDSPSCRRYGIWNNDVLD